MRRRISNVIDGDTFVVGTKVNGSNYIRIAGRDSPEKGEPGYATAKRELERLKGKTVTLQPVAGSYGRTVAKVRHNRKLIR
ncbi:MAG: hypothetical protein ABH864_02340 [archaeon]